jgi:hypothetical protein
MATPLGRYYLVALACAALGSSSGAQPGTTGAPGAEGAEPTCIACHATRALNPAGAGRLALEGLPERYRPGQRYSLHLSVSDPDPALRRFGFQLTALATATLAAAGELVVTDPANTQRIDALDGGRQYLGHTLAGTAASGDGGARWSFEWIAPPSDAGPVAFFAAANAADVDGSKEGDHVYSASPSPLASVAGPPSSKEEP